MIRLLSGRKPTDRGDHGQPSKLARGDAAHLLWRSLDRRTRRRASQYPFGSYRQTATGRPIRPRPLGTLPPRPEAYRPRLPAPGVHGDCRRPRFHGAPELSRATPVWEGKPKIVLDLSLQKPGPRSADTRPAIEADLRRPLTSARVIRQINSVRRDIDDEERLRALGDIEPGLELGAFIEGRSKGFSFRLSVFHRRDRRPWSRDMLLRADISM